jgi:hypothetical protein
MKYQLNAISNLVIDGVTVAAGETIAVLDTDFDPSNIFSACWFGDAKPIATAAPVSSETRHVRRVTLTAADVVTTLQPAPVAIDTDPDTLNALDAAEETPSQEIPSQETPSQQTAADPAANPFDGLAPRIAEALLAAGFSTRDAVASVAADGADAFLDYDGIGKSAAKKIIAWLGSE